MGGQLGPGDLLRVDTDTMWRGVQSALDGLSDEEYRWEPVPGCWTVRLGEDGTPLQDWTPDPPVPPFTTIGWRVAHIGQSMASHSLRLFGTGSFSYATYRPAGTVDGELRFLRESFAQWRGAIDARADELSSAIAAEVISFNHHHLGHAKEIDTIRQLFRAHRPADPDLLTDACVRGDVDRVRALVSGAPTNNVLVRASAEMARWEVVEALLELGLPPDTTEGATALHFAAAFGPLRTVELLVSHGADVGRIDPQWDATPEGWAQYFANHRNAAFLKRRTEGG